MARRGRYYRSRPQRRVPEWVRVIPDAPVPVSHVGVDLLPPSTIDRGSVIGSTVVRVRGTIQFHQDDSLRPTLGHVWLGVYVSEDVVSETTTPINVPVRRNLEKWMYWQHVPESDMPARNNTLDFAATAATLGMVSYSFDIRAQRKVRGTNAGPILVIQPSGLVGTTMYWATSTLIKLS